VLYNNLRELIDFIDIIAMDFKLPSSTTLKGFWREHREFLKISLAKNVFVKAVMGKKTGTDDLLKAIKIIKEIKPDLFFILQPQNPFEDVLENKLKFFQNICEDNKINAKIIPQLHKKLGIK
jgi:organic radical activating enzyme